MATLQTIRRAIAQRTGQPFFLEMGSGATATGGSTTSLIDTAKIVQADDTWNGNWVYLPTIDVVRKIADTVQSTNTISWLGATTAPINGTAYEIWSTFSPKQVNEAINQALRDAWPFFFQISTQYLVIQNDVGVSYSLTGLSPAPRFLSTVYLESPGTSYTGQVTTVVAQNRLKDTGRTFTSDDVNREVRIYEGTSQGDCRTITSIIDSNTVEVDSNFTTTLSTTSKYRVVDTLDNTMNFTFINNWSVDKFSNPTQLRLASHPFGLEGYHLRLVYEAEYTALSTESTDTTAPQEYVELAAMTRVYLQKLSTAPPSELKNWATMYQATADAAAQYAAKNRFSHLPSTYLDDQEAGAKIGPEYPF